MAIKLEPGKFYWIRHRFENIWHPVYVGYDYDWKNLWIFRISSMDIPDQEISKMDLTQYQIKRLSPPKSS